MNDKDSKPPTKKPVRRGSGTQIVLEDLRKLMVEVATQAANMAAEKVVLSAEERMKEIVQTALEAYCEDDTDTLAAALKELTTDEEKAPESRESSRARRRAPRKRLGAGARPGTYAMARVGNGHLPVRIKAGPFKVNGKDFYKVDRLTPGKSFTQGMKPLAELFEFTEEDAEALKQTQTSTPPINPN